MTSHNQDIQLRHNTPHDNSQDLTGNPMAVDLTNIDQVQEQILSRVPVAGAEATNAQYVQPDPVIHRVTPDAQYASTTHQLISDSNLEQQSPQLESDAPADNANHQLTSDNPDATIHGFLGCSSAIFETALVELFHNASVEDGVVVSTIQGKPVAILGELFSSTFAFPLEGLSDLHEVPQDLVLEARRAFSYDGKLVSTSCSWMTAIYAGIPVNWSKILFKVLKDMVTPGSKKARGFAVQTCIVLKGNPDLELVELKEFPPLKILTANTVGKYIAINKNIVVEDVEDEPVMEKKAEKKKVVCKKRPAPTVVSPVVKRKRTSRRTTPVATELTLVAVAQEAVPIQMISAVTPPAPKRKAPKRRLQLPTGSDDEIVEKESDVDDDIFGVEQPSKTTDEESMSIEDLMKQIPDDAMIPSVTAEGPTRIKFGLGIQIPGVNEVDPYIASLPQIAATDKGKEPLVLREQVMEDVNKFVNSFSLRRLAVYHSPSPISKPSIYQGADPTASVVQADTALVATEPDVQIQHVSVTTDPAIQLTENPNPDTPGSGILSQQHPLQFLTLHVQAPLLILTCASLLMIFLKFNESKELNSRKGSPSRMQAGSARDWVFSSGRKVKRFQFSFGYTSSAGGYYTITGSAQLEGTVPARDKSAQLVGTVPARKISKQISSAYPTVTKSRSNYHRLSVQSHIQNSTAHLN
ncbi:hypothetical protein F511_22668 [Dorcoceras hygrometricum]|uniref:Uncharacterized protein n=1 Tax=Dorcoceras hygrometricum TaxID=472368 RepID=A0A2Z7CXD6_9LAMI|nr:hypothetical protein F511_22668 [Dorcoceras hygrometricum]